MTPTLNMLVFVQAMMMAASVRDHATYRRLERIEEYLIQRYLREE